MTFSPFLNDIQESAKQSGLVDTPHGIHFARDPNLPPPCLINLFVESKKVKALSGKTVKENEPLPVSGKSTGRKKYSDLLVDLENDNPVLVEYQKEIKRMHEESYPLVKEEDRALITDALYITMEHMEVCKFVEFDRVSVYKGRDLGFRGLACKYCQGIAGAGRYFPSSEASLSQTTTSITFINHIRRCLSVPKAIRDRLEAIPTALESPENVESKKGSKKSDRPLHGGRKVFFHRLWCRVHQLELNETDEVEKAWEVKKASKVSSRQGDDDEDDVEVSTKKHLKNSVKNSAGLKTGLKRYRRSINIPSRKRKERDVYHYQRNRRILRGKFYSESDSSEVPSSDNEENQSWDSESTSIEKRNEAHDDEIHEASVVEDEESSDHGDECDSEMSADMTKMVETAARWLTELDQAGASVIHVRPQKARGRGRQPPNIQVESSN